MLGCRLQPKAHLGHYAQIGLGEGQIPGRAIAEGEEVPGVIALHRAHAGADEIALRQDNLHAADVLGVQSIRRVADAVVQRIAHDGAPAIARHRHPAFSAIALDMLVEVVEADPRLDDAVSQLVVIFEDLVHPAQIQDDAARQARRGRAIAQILAARDRPERNLVLVGEAENRLHFLHAAGRYRCRRRKIRFGAWRVNICIGVAVEVGGKHPVLADNARKSL